MTFRTIFCAATLSAILSTAASAQDACTVDVDDPYDLDEAGIAALYDCIKDTLAENYAKDGHEIGLVYRDWAVTSTAPAIAGTHGDRFVQTFANDLAAEQYLKFEEDGVAMPVGSVLAKESYKVNKKKVAKTGPLFLMTKLEAGSAPESNDWLYGGVKPNGKPMKVKQSFCHDCHANYDGQDSLAYPLEEVRITN